MYSALDLTPPLPTTLGVLSKWAAEFVRHVFLPSSTFIANTKGYPVLPKPAQSFIRNCMIVSLFTSFFVLWKLTKPVRQHRPNVILAGVGEGHHSRGGEAAYKQYVRHLENSSPAVQASQTKGTVENFAQGYQDYLQAPLQVSASPRRAGRC
jgi:protein arginine N-methyltransferase 5